MLILLKELIETQILLRGAATGRGEGKISEEHQGTGMEDHGIYRNISKINYYF